MKLLVNGCSFSANYYLANNLAKQIGLDGAVSIANGGSSNRRIIRTTLEYLEEHNDIGFVLIGLSFSRRKEGTFLPVEKDVDNWVQYSNNGIQWHYIPEGSKFKTSKEQVEQYIQDVYATDLDIKHIDQLLCDLTLLSGYLSNRGINHLFYNFCERRYLEYFENVNSKYQQIVERNPHIVPLDKFIANLFLYEHGAKYAEPEERWMPFARHYNGDEYIHLNNYFIHYLRTHKLI
jgi:hypothetical protein